MCARRRSPLHNHGCDLGGYGAAVAAGEDNCRHERPDSLIMEITIMGARKSPRRNVRAAWRPARQHIAYENDSSPLFHRLVPHLVHLLLNCSLAEVPPLEQPSELNTGFGQHRQSENKRVVKRQGKFADTAKEIFPLHGAERRGS